MPVELEDWEQFCESVIWMALHLFLIGYWFGLSSDWQFPVFYHGPKLTGGVVGELLKRRWFSSKNIYIWWDGGLTRVNFGRKLSRWKITRRGKVLILILTDFFLLFFCQVTHRTSPKSLAISLTFLNRHVNKTRTIEDQSSILASPSHATKTYANTFHLSGRSVSHTYPSWSASCPFWFQERRIGQSH